MMLFVLGLGHVLVALHQLGPLLRLVQRRGAGPLRTDRNHREQPLELRASARRTRGGVAGADQLLEFALAPGAAILVDRHGRTVLGASPLRKHPNSDCGFGTPTVHLLLLSGRGSAW